VLAEMALEITYLATLMETSGLCPSNRGQCDANTKSDIIDESEPPRHHSKVSPIFAGQKRGYAGL
jgi:hypothetical protein